MAVIEETIRLYPPIAAISRDELAGCQIEAGSLVVISSYVLHRHRTLWERPDEFDPNRFLNRTRANMDRFSYLPFGAGPRVCIGAGFALQNAAIIIATLMKNFQLDLVPGTRVWPVHRVTVRPENGLPMIVSRRPI
jgi:cytochrome P450